MRDFTPSVQFTRDGLLFALGVQAATENQSVQEAAQQSISKDTELNSTSSTVIQKVHDTGTSVDVVAKWEAAKLELAGESSRPLRMHSWENLHSKSTPVLMQVNVALEEVFDQRLSDWKAETAFTSSVTEIVLNAHYQRIIGMGKSAVPLMLKSLRAEPCQLFWALRAITDEDPVPDEHIGDLNAMSREWINWGIERGFISSEEKNISSLSEIGLVSLQAD